MMMTNSAVTGKRMTDYQTDNGYIIEMGERVGKHQKSR